MQAMDVVSPCAADVAFRTRCCTSHCCLVCSATHFGALMEHERNCACIDLHLPASLRRTCELIRPKKASAFLESKPADDGSPSLLQWMHHHHQLSAYCCTRTGVQAQAQIRSPAPSPSRRRAADHGSGRNPRPDTAISDVRDTPVPSVPFFHLLSKLADVGSPLLKVES
jgi:hypothetical protein